MSRTKENHRAVALSFPRVSGDEPVPGTLLYWGNPFSPRERG